MLGSSTVSRLWLRWPLLKGMADDGAQEVFPWYRTARFWQPLSAWCHRTRLGRLTDRERKGFKFLFDGYCGALGFGPEGGKSIRELQNRGKCQEVMAGLRRMLATFPVAEDSGFAVDVKGMRAKDGCARCYTLRLGGAYLPYQVHLLALDLDMALIFRQRALNESLDASFFGSDSFGTLYNCTSCGEIMTHAFSCRLVGDFFGKKFGKKSDSIG